LTQGENGGRAYNPEECTKMIHHLLKQIQDLTVRVNKMESQQNRSIRKNITDYLKLPQNAPPTTFTHWWKKAFELKDDEFICLKDQTYTEFIRYIVDSRFSSSSQPQDPPICAFTESKNTIYLYDQWGDEIYWKKVELQEMERIINKIHIMVKRYHQQVWQPRFQEQIEECGTTAEENRNYLLKTTDTDSLKIKSERFLRQMMRIIYEKIHEPIQPIIEYITDSEKIEIKNEPQLSHIPQCPIKSN
jgi:hypothetical protein